MAKFANHVEDAIQRNADMLDVVLVIVLANVDVREVAGFLVEPLDSPADVVQYPAAERSGNQDCDIEQNLHLTHVISPTVPVW